MFLKRDADKKSLREIDNWIFKEGFFYESRMLSREVNPVRIKGVKDSKILFHIFVNYWYRARIYSEQSDDTDKFIPIIKDEKELDIHIEMLLKKYYS